MSVQTRARVTLRLTLHTKLYDGFQQRHKLHLRCLELRDVRGKTFREASNLINSPVLRACTDELTSKERAMYTEQINR